MGSQTHPPLEPQSGLNTYIIQALVERSIDAIEGDPNDRPVIIENNPSTSNSLDTVDNINTCKDDSTNHFDINIFYSEAKILIKDVASIDIEDGSNAMDAEEPVPESTLDLKGLDNLTKLDADVSQERKNLIKFTITKNKPTFTANSCDNLTVT